MSQVPRQLLLANSLHFAATTVPGRLFVDATGRDLHFCPHIERPTI
jgi:hypothetical protein